jgi:conjugative transfer pilus assembly protein TraH
MRVVVALVLCIFLSSQIAYGKGILDKLVILSSENRPEVWQDQMGGYMSGGSMHARIPSANLKLLTIDLPSLGMGCSGIDLFGGGFGYINSEQLEKLLKTIGSQASNYLVMLTIKSISPQIADLLENLEATARFINSQNINDCKMAASLAAGLFPKTQASQALACQSRQMAGSSTMDFFTARYNCSDPAEMSAKNDNAQDAVLPTEYNLTWEALKKGSSGLSDEDKEFLMSLSGTIIARKSNDTLVFENKNTLIKDAKMLEALIFGTEAGNFEVYKCDHKEKCLAPTLEKKKFSPEDSMMYKIRKLMDSIAGKILAENEGQVVSLTKEEGELATRTPIPIIENITLNASLKGHGVTLTIEDYVEAIAFDYVIAHLESLIEFVYKTLGQLEHTQLEGETVSKFKEEVRHVQSLLSADRAKAYERLNTLISIKMRTQQLKTHVMTAFAEYRGS